MSRPSIARLRPAPPLAAMVKPRVTVGALARAYGCSSSYVSRILTGERPAPRRFRAVAVQLTGLPEAVLFGDTLADTAEAS